jgi:calcineurin-like phosphoesterase family protein
LKHCPRRGEINGFDVDDVEAHDKWLIDKWNKTIGKKDIVYIVGDFAFGSSESVKKLLGKLNGQKFLILGNHDKSSDHLDGYFAQITQMKCVTFKKSNYDFLDEDFMVYMCHYPMITWPSKHYGCVQCQGHCHGRLDNLNEESTDLRVDVGIDSKLADFGFVSLPQLYSYFKEKSKGEKFLHYAMTKKEEKSMII